MLARGRRNGQSSAATGAGPEPIGGAEIRAAFIQAAQHLREQAPEVDAINVYPVPDGDTGTNMAATLGEAVARTVTLAPNASLAEILDGLARGALYGARGNSGVILSQALRGFARGVGQVPALSGAALAEGLGEAARAAYAAVGDPREGTMLTVLRCAGEAAAAHVADLQESGRRADCTALLALAIKAAEAAEAGTIEQLPELAEAGVTDAGGEGICVILRGLQAALTGVAPEVRHRARRPALGRQSDPRGFGFCTEFLLEAPNAGVISPARVREIVSAGGNSSILVVGDERALHVHVHTGDPHGLLSEIGALGRLSRTKVESMDAQHIRYRETGSGAGRPFALLALSRGEGFDQVFRGLGAEVTDLGEVVKPPAGEIAEVADRLGVPEVIVLANHRNVVLSARQAATLTRCTLHVVPSRSLVQGVAAAMVFDTRGALAENLRRMEEAAASVRTVEVTIAAASRNASGVTVVAGDAIALVDNQLVTSTANPDDALIEGLRRASAGDAALVTIYGGFGKTAADLDEMRARIVLEFPGLEVECVDGGQPLYPFIASVES